MKAFSSIVIRVPMVLRVFQAKIISYEELLANIITKRHERSPRPPGVDRVQTLAACNRTRHEVRRAFEPVGMSEASKHCTDSTDSTDFMSMWPSSFFLTWSRHDCIIGPHVLLRCREQCNHLNLAIEKQQYQWFQEIIKVLRLGKKKGCAIRTQIERQIKLWFINYIGPCQAIHLNQHFDQNHFAIQQIFFRWLHKI